MDNLITILKSLNRKERFFLIADALGNQDFQLGDGFRTELGSAAKVEIPSDAWVAMDYHLDWLSAALHVCAEELPPATPWKNSSVVEGTNLEVVKGNQEDVDLIVGFDTPDGTTLILIEAKMDTAWSNTQMKSKVQRIKAMFGQDGFKRSGVTPILVLTSPTKPRDLKTTTWPEWMAPGGEWRWMPMKVAEGRTRLYRCNADGKSSANAGYAVIKKKTESQPAISDAD